MNGGGSGGLNFDDFMTAMVDVPSRAPGLDLIEPGDSDNSFLIQKLEGTQGAGNGSQMPRGRAPMSSEDIALIRDFIDNTLAP
ncbi:MAG: hypothetical protein AAFX99_32110 [Myxococcota bacterium]